MILAILFATGSITFLGSASDAVPLGDYTGSGTADDPYDGTLMFGTIGYDSNPWELYITVGSTLEWGSREPTAGMGYTWHVIESLGLDFEEGHGIPVGTIQYAGTYEVVREDLLGNQTTLRFYAVESGPLLEFLSDPSDPLYATVSYGRT